jgi:hypothetical protein
LGIEQELITHKVKLDVNFSAIQQRPARRIVLEGQQKVLRRRRGLTSQGLLSGLRG